MSKSVEEPNLCSIDGCARVAVTRGWCHAHYLRWRRTGDTSDERKVGEKRNTICEVGQCERLAVTRGMCSTHYGRFKRTGSVDADRPIGAKSDSKECAVDGCTATATERGWCHGHYLRWVRVGDVHAERPLGQQVNTHCTVEKCDRLAVACGLCAAHGTRMKKHGDVRADEPIREVVGTGYVHHGYFVVPVPPEFRHLTNKESPVLEHRLEMAKLLGRPLREDESVHHINGDRLDNRTNGPLMNFRSGNLELWSRWQPRGQRVEDKVEYAIELLERYLPEALARQVPLNIPRP